MKKARKCDVTKALKRDAERMVVVERIPFGGRNYDRMIFDECDQEVDIELADWWGISPWGMND